MALLIPIGVRRLWSYAIVDDESYDLLMQYPWSAGSFATGDATNCYAQRSRSKRWLHISMHRLVVLLAGIDIPPGMFVDHINGQRYDNQLHNLRVVTPLENMRNLLTRKPYGQRMIRHDRCAKYPNWYLTNSTY
jgi:hypothetical protein